MSKEKQPTEPKLQPVLQCRMCNSKNIERELFRKNYFLFNLSTSVPMSYAVCRDCQYIFQGEYVGDEFLGHYYRHSPMLRREKPTEYEEDQNRRQASFVERYRSLQGSSVLEIGAHAGAFLSHVQKEFGCTVYYHELSEEACKVLATIPHLRNIEDYPEERVDLVVLRHVLEHVDDIPFFVSSIRDRLNAEGVLYIEVPDWSWLDADTDPFIFEHLSQFNTYNLVHFMMQQGWVCEALEKSICADDPATPNRVQRFIFKPSALPRPHLAEIKESVVDFYENFEGAWIPKINALLDSLGEASIALYPASHLSFAALADTDFVGKNVIGLFDIDTKKHGGVVHGIEIFPAQKLAEHQPDYIFIFSMAYEPEIRDSFKKMDLKAKIISISEINHTQQNQKR